MRIIAGHERSRVLIAPRGQETRPTQDRVREAVFNMLAALVDWDDLRVLDLFAGSGALALEALSRGAAYADLVDSARDAIKAIEQNIQTLNYGDRARAHAMDWTRAIPKLGGGYGLLFADPPYRMSAAPAVQAAAERGLLLRGAIVVIEHGRDAKPELPEAFAPLTARAYGTASIAIYRWE